MRTSNDRGWEHRKRLQDLIERMELEYDKALLALHPLGISVSAALYNQMLAAKITIQSVYILHWSWVVWILGIVATLVSFRTSVKANLLALDQHDLGQQLDEKLRSEVVRFPHDLLQHRERMLVCRWRVLGRFILFGVAVSTKRGTDGTRNAWVF
jgi:hypothetical protein